MKQGSLKIFCLIIWASIVVLSAHASDAVSLESRILESFNGEDGARYVWRAQGSRFTTVLDDVQFPRIQYIDAFPGTVHGFNRPSDAPTVRSLGIHGRFDRQGHNWIDIYPMLTDVEENAEERQMMIERGLDPDTDPAEIIIPGVVRNIDMWVWGSNLRFYIEIYVRDYRGVVFSLPLGDINFRGWRNLSVNIPDTINQTRRTEPSHAGLTFVKFRIWTRPVERVDNFFIYFNQLKVLTNVHDQHFDGRDLADPRNVRRLWDNN